MTQTLFHHYELQGMIGSGWLGPVHRARDLNAGQDVALRLISDACNAHSFLIMQLQRLLFKVNSLSHPHILRTEPLQQRERRSFYAMGYAEHGSVRRLLQEVGGPLPIRLAVGLVQQAALGLAFAHRQGLIHGNLKPENLLLSSGTSFVDEERYTVQLSDFGLAELRDSQGSFSGRLGSSDLAYHSPERQLEIRTDKRSDLYALGLILHELLLGHLPKRFPLYPRSLTAQREQISPALENVLLTCLQAEPQDRYASAEELHQALSALLDAQLDQEPETGPGRASGWRLEPNLGQVAKIEEELPSDLTEAELAPALAAVGGSDLAQPAPSRPTDPRALSAEEINAALQQVVRQTSAASVPTAVQLPPKPSLAVSNWSPVPQLRVLNQEHDLVREQLIEGKGFTLGRALGNTVLLEHQGVSRQHLKVEFQDAQALVTVLSATNPVYLKGQALPPQQAVPWPFEEPLYVPPYWLILLPPAPLLPQEIPASRPGRRWIYLLSPVAALLLGVLSWWSIRPPSISEFMLSSGGQNVSPEQAFQLQWTTEHARKVEILELGQQGQGLPLSGKTTVAGLRQPQQYTLVASSWLGRRSVRTTTVMPQFATPVILSFEVSPAQVSGREPVTVSWSTRYVEKVHISGLGPVNASGSKVLYPTEDMELRLTAVNGEHEVTRTQGLRILAPQITRFSAEPATARPGQTVTLRWQTAHATQATLSGSGLEETALPLSGEKTLTAQASGRYTLIVRTVGEKVTSETVQVQVSTPPQITQLAISPNPPTSGQRFNVSWATKGVKGVKLEYGDQSWVAGPSGQRSFKAVAQALPVLLTTENQDGTQSSRVVQVKTAPSNISQPPPEPLKPLPQQPVSPPQVGLPKADQPKTTPPKLTRPLPPTVQLAPVISRFDLEPASLSSPGPVTLSWDVKGAKSISISGLRGPNPDGSWPAEGRATAQVSGDQTFVLQAGSQLAQRSVSVLQSAPGPRIVSFEASTADLGSSGRVRLSWKVEGVQEVQIRGVPGALPAQGSTEVSVEGSTSFTLTAGSARRTVQVSGATARPKNQAYDDLAGTWTHPRGTFTISEVQGNRASGTFTSDQPGLESVSLKIIFNGQTLTALAPNVPDFRLVARIEPDRNIIRGPYTLRGAREGWCAYRNTKPPDCR